MKPIPSTYPSSICRSFLAWVLVLFAMSLLSASAQTELITNGGFETTGAGFTWILQTNGTNQTDSWWNFNLASGAHSGNRYEYLGAQINGSSPANNVNGLLYQTVTIPAGITSATLSYWLRITTSEASTAAYDHLYVEIQNTSGGVLATVNSYSNQNASSFSSWTQQVVNLSGYAGQTIRVAFHGTTDSGTITVFRIDDVSLQVTAGETISVPGSIAGEPNPIQNTSYSYSVGASTSSLGHAVEYSFNWGDGTSSSYSTSTSASHSWSSTGQKYIVVTARCQTHTTITANNSPGNYVTVQPAPPAVTVTAPTGGENWTAGTTHSITWSVSGSTANIAYYKVALSTDGGATWPAAGTANDLTPSGIYDPAARTFSWAIGSSLNTNQARIRVRALATDSTILAENAITVNFTISPAPLSRASGLDVSHLRGTINWSSVAGSGRTFAIIKATDGYRSSQAQPMFTDPNFSTYIPAAIQAGLKVGAYHFARPYINSAKDEADFFISVAGNYMGTGFLPPAVDIEDPSDDPPSNQVTNMGQTALSQWIREFCSEIQRVKGVKPMLYMTPYFTRNLIDSDLAQYPLWIAYYPSTSDVNPSSLGPWNTAWTFLQYAVTGTSVPGVQNSPVDLDVFNGDTTALNTYVNGGSTSDNTPPSITAFAVNPSLAALGQGFTATYTTSDAGGSHLKQIELWRANVDGTINDSSWTRIGSIVALSGDGPSSGSFPADIPASSGNYWYGIHVIDNAGNYVNERVAGRGPIQTTVGSAGGNWTPLAHTAPNSIELMILLPDGTVMAASGYTSGSQVGNGWYRLTPDSSGSYVNGTWTTLGAMQDTRLWYSSAVLRDGRVFVAGGEYGTGANKAEIYNPLTNTWTPLTVPAGLIDTNLASDGSNGGFRDSICKLLSDGTVLIAPVFPANSNRTLIYNPSANTWAQGPSYIADQNEASWVKLPDNSILTIDKSSSSSERYLSSAQGWVSDSTVPINLYDPYGDELGAALLLPNGKAFFLGATGHSAIYTPSGNATAGAWTAGPDIPNAQGTPDAAAAMMVNGKILCAVSGIPTFGDHFPAPTSFYEYDYSTGSVGSFTRVSSPTGGFTDGISSYKAVMLDLPDGTVLYSHFGSDLYIYQPSGSALASGKPVVTSISQNADGSYHLTGTGLNGISEGASYGDDAQMDSNYPLVRVTDGGGNKYYLRTFNWSSTGVMTGNTPVTTEFKNAYANALAPGNYSALPPGTYSLVVVANGISSDSVNFTIQSQYTITASAGSGGTISPNGNVTKNAGDNQTFTAFPNASYVVSQWQLDGGVAQNGGSNYTLSNIQAIHSVQVTFAFVASTDANLSSLTVSSGGLTPVFSTANTSYSASVSNPTASITVTPTASNTNAAIKVRVNGGTFSSTASGAASGSLALNVGANTVDIQITAQDGITVRTYSLAVDRRTAYGDWALTQGLGNSDPSADFDGDGLANLLEWSFGINPTSSKRGVVIVSGGALAARGEPTTLSSPNGSGGTDYFALFCRRKDATTVGLTYTVEFSAGLSTWIASSSTPNVVADDGEIQAVTVQFPPLVNGQPTRFFRIRVFSP